MVCLQALMLDAVGPLTDLLEKISESSSIDGGEEEQGVDLRTLSSQPLHFWGMRLPSSQLIGGQRSSRNTTKIYCPFQRRWNQISEQQPCCCLANHSPNRLQITWVIKKVKGKGKKVFSMPPCKDRLVGRGEQALPSKLWTQGDIRSDCSQEAAEMTARAEGSDCRRAKGSDFCNVNTKCVNCQSCIATAACYGFPALRYQDL